MLLEPANHRFRIKLQTPILGSNYKLRVQDQTTNYDFRIKLQTPKHAPANLDLGRVAPEHGVEGCSQQRYRALVQIDRDLLVHDRL